MRRLKTIQKYIDFNNSPKLIIEILNDRTYSLNRKEIHGELSYLKIYEFEKYKPLLEFFVKKLNPQDRNPRYLLMLRKMCKIDKNPLPMI